MKHYWNIRDIIKFTLTKAGSKCEFLFGSMEMSNNCKFTKGGVVKVYVGFGAYGLKAPR